MMNRILKIVVWRGYHRVAASMFDNMKYQKCKFKDMLKKDNHTKNTL